MKKIIVSVLLFCCVSSVAWSASQDFKGTVNGNTLTAGTGTITMSAGKTLTVSETASIDEGVALSSKAPKASPTFTGTVTAPIITSTGGTTASLASAAVETIIAAEQASIYLVTVIYGEGQYGTWRGAWLVSYTSQAGGFVLMGADTSHVGLVFSGANIQIKNLNASTVTLTWNSLRIR